MSEELWQRTEDLGTSAEEAGTRADASASRGLDPLLYLPIAAYVDEVDGEGSVRTSFGSQKYEALTGIPPSDAFTDGACWDERVHPDDRDAYIRSFDQLSRTRTEQDIVYRFRRPDDTWVWLRDRATAVYDDHRAVTVISGVIADVTRERDAEEQAARTLASLEAAVEERTRELELSLEELEASRANLAHAQELACAGSFEWTAHGACSASDELCRIYGVPPAAGLDKAAALAAVHRDDRATFAAAVVAAEASGGETSAQYRIVRPDGEIRTLDARVHVEHDSSGAPARVVGSVQDVTERRAAEEATRRSRDLLQMLAEVSARFIAMPLATIDEGILDTLARIGDFVGADRAYVFLLSGDGKVARNTHEWCAPGVEPQMSRLQRVHLADFSWWRSALEADETIRIERLCDLPPAAAAECRAMAEQGIRSLLVVPLAPVEALQGYIGFDAVTREFAWPQETVLLLRTVADTVAGALERQRVGLALSESEANHRAVFEAVDDVILVTDETGRILHGNPSAAGKLGYSLDELRGTRVLDLHPAAMRDEAASVFAAMLAGERTTCPLPLQRRDGALIPVETHVSRGTWNGRPCLFGVSKDLTAEREALDRFDRFFRANPALMAVSDTADDRFVDVNDAFSRVLGYTKDEVIGATSRELGLFDQPDHHAHITDELERTGRVRDVELRVRTRDGRVRDGAFSGELIETLGRRLFLTVMLDITDRKLAERELRAVNATLEQRVGERTRELTAANRELEGFVQSVAHDLRGPLRTIGSFGQILQLEHAGELSADGRDSLARILRANARLTRLIDGLLELSRFTRHALHVEPVDLTDVARHVVDDLRELQPAHTVDVTIAEGLVADADQALITIVLENLLGNAWKFSATRDPAHVAFFCERYDAETVFCVRDDGVGFDQRYAHRLFEAFERLHDDTEFGGTGIGLATVRRIVERHGGRVWAESEVDRGAMFFFTLP